MDVPAMSHMSTSALPARSKHVCSLLASVHRRIGASVSVPSVRVRSGAAVGRVGAVVRQCPRAAHHHHTTRVSTIATHPATPRTHIHTLCGSSALGLPLRVSEKHGWEVKPTLSPLCSLCVGCSGGGTALGVAASHTIMDAKSVMKVGAMPTFPHPRICL